MGSLAEAVLEDGRKIPYVIQERPPHGGMKHTYFSPDNSYVVQFFNDPSMENDPNLRKRLQAIIGRYNPTLSEKRGGALGNTAEVAEYFAELFCWPTALVKYPRFGIVCPAYAPNFFFDNLASYEYDLAGHDKRSTWFTTSRRKYLAKAELGNFRSMLQISVLLARCVRRMHQAGLAHSDLSNNNVLIDPKTGSCVVIDIDTLVVPGLFPPEVIGTPGYIAPEILASLVYPHGHPERKSSTTQSDLHALAVLLYEYLLHRHPLAGPKFANAETEKEYEYLTFGKEATFVEHPTDTSNHLPTLKATICDLGPILEKLFLRAFVDGIHQPNLRPSALEWERGLEQTQELLQPCKNLTCDHKWFVLHDPSYAQCPFCGHALPKGTELVRFCFKSQMRGRAGLWIGTGETNVLQNMPLYQWHMQSNVYPNEKVKPIQQAEVYKVNGRWVVLNKAVQGMLSPQGVLVPIGGQAVLEDGCVFRTAGEPQGLLAEVQIGAI